MVKSKLIKHRSLPPTTTAQEDEVTRGQRAINRVWEYTQSIIALTVTLSLIYVSIMNIDSEELKNAFFLIIGFYFSRTNHQSIGGEGKKPLQKYIGR
jgi:hypothetical protein